jgi:hypothetical protein
LVGQGQCCGCPGKPIYTPDGKILKTKIQMQDATFADGTKQSLYFPLGHAKEGLFKGMEVILKEHGVVAGSEGLEDVEVVWCCLVVSLDRLSGFALFSNPFHPSWLPFRLSSVRLSH